MNDFVRDKLTDKKGNISPYAEVLAGCCVSYSIILNKILKYVNFSLIKNSK